LARTTSKPAPRFNRGYIDLNTNEPTVEAVYTSTSRRVDGLPFQKEEQPSMNGIVFQERRCPRCAVRHTARVESAGNNYCFNCRLRWEMEPAQGAPDLARPAQEEPDAAPPAQSSDRVAPAGGQPPRSQAQSLGPWPPGWPLPISAMAPGLSWEDAMEAYIEYSNVMWGTVEEPAATLEEPLVEVPAPWTTTRKSAGDLLAAAKELAPRIRELADEGERLGDMPPAFVEAIRAAGLWDDVRPAGLGGHEIDLAGHLRIVEEIARADGSAGWNFFVGATAGFYLGLSPEPVAREIYARYPNLIAGGSAAPQGRAVPVDGGYRISGRFTFGSGIRQADLMGCGCIVFDGDKPRIGPNGAPEMLMALVPTVACEILDTWHVSGLRSTGSADFVVSECIVPAEWCWPGFFLVGAAPHTAGPLYRCPVPSFAAVGIGAVGLGIAHHAIEALVELAAEKRPAGQTSLLRDLSRVQAEVARAEGLYRGGRALLYQTAGTAWEALVAGDELSPAERGGIRLAATMAVQQAAQAVDLMHNAGGTTSIYESYPLERCFRDIHALTQHAMVNPATLELAGKVLLGVEPGAAPL
jgi:alkylation response protein AidB-like acyl-CoA dehydrogenase